MLGKQDYLAAELVPQAVGNIHLTIKTRNQLFLPFGRRSVDPEFGKLVQR